MRTETFQLSKGTITLTEDKILVLGDDARKKDIQQVIIVIIANLYNLINLFTEYKNYVNEGRPKHHGFFFFLTLVILLFIALLYRFIKISVVNEIGLKNIKKVKSTVGFAASYPVVQLYLDNHKKRLLQFGSKDDLRFLETLKQRGVHVK
jgi:hypothetical protein